jgi:putative phosphoesterase
VREFSTKSAKAKAMRIGVVSDTHGHADRAQQAARMLESLEVARQFRNWPTHYVFGNCDVQLDALAAGITELGHTCHGWVGEIDLGGIRIALLHGHQAEQFKRALSNPDIQLVCYGHTHVAAQERRDGKLVLNPGALYRANPPSLAVVELPSCEATIVAV